MELLAPHQQNCRFSRAKSLSQFICLSLLVNSLLLMGLTTQGQELSKEQVSGILPLLRIFTMPTAVLRAMMVVSTSRPFYGMENDFPIAKL